MLDTFKQSDSRDLRRSKLHPHQSHINLKSLSLAFFIVLFGLYSTDLSSRRLSNEVPAFYKTYFSFSDWEQYWEDIFGAKQLYDGTGNTSALPREANNIGYVLTLTHCPKDEYSSPDLNDPGHSFYDAAAVLKYSILRNTYPASSKYNSTMYALVYPDAIRCRTPNGDDYDRVKVLQHLGYFVFIWGSPVYKKNLKPYVRDNIEKDAGLRDLLKITALRLDNHPIIVLVDFTTLMLHPIDDTFDDFISKPEEVTSFSLDYPTNLPNTGSNSGPSSHWIMMKPSNTLLDDIVKVFHNTEYSPSLGWNNEGVSNFHGVLGVKGILAHYFTRVKKGQHSVLNRCLYGNDNSNPYGVDPHGNTICRDPSDCEDCRFVDFDSINIIKMLPSCGKPWECAYNESLDESTLFMCEKFHHAWFSARLSFEESFWHNGPKSHRHGLFHPETFLGYCSCQGALCYDRMIDDKSAPDVCTKDTQTNIAVGTMKLHDALNQNYRLSLTTGKFSGTPTACVQGEITVDGFFPPYHIGIVIDTSDSTRISFKEFRIGDLNRDGESNTILDAEIASVLALLEKIAFDPTLGNDNVNIGLITFSSEAKYHGEFPPCDTKNPSLINPALKMKLLSLRSSGYTNFEGALESALEYFRRPSLAGTNLLYLLSDGIPSAVGDEDMKDPIEMPIESYPMTLNFERILQELDFMNVKRFSFGIGLKSDTRKGFELDRIDSRRYMHTDMGPQQVNAHDDIKNALFSNSIIGKIIDFGISVNGVLQGDFDASNVVNSLTGFTFGTFVVRDLNPMYGETNRVTVSVTIDFDGDIGTSSDQVTISVEDVIIGGLM